MAVSSVPSLDPPSPLTSLNAFVRIFSPSRSQLAAVTSPEKSFAAQALTASDNDCTLRSFALFGSPCAMSDRRPSKVSSLPPPPFRHHSMKCSTAGDAVEFGKADTLSTTFTTMMLKLARVSQRESPTTRCAHSSSISRSSRSPSASPAKLTFTANELNAANLSEYFLACSCRILATPI